MSYPATFSKTFETALYRKFSLDQIVVIRANFYSLWCPRMSGLSTVQFINLCKKTLVEVANQANNLRNGALVDLDAELS
jgi:hypothetical protein